METTHGDVGFAPRLDQATRDTFLHALGAHFAAGRISVDELDRRVEAALAAEVEADLEALAADLSGVPSTAAASPSDVAEAPGTRGVLRSRWAALGPVVAAGGTLVAVAGHGEGVTGFAAGAAATALGLVAHWGLSLRRPLPETAPEPVESQDDAATKHPEPEPEAESETEPEPGPETPVQPVFWMPAQRDGHG